MSVLRQELGLPGPNSHVYDLARKISARGFIPPSRDWLTTSYPNEQQRRRAVLQEGGIELSAISAAVVGGLAQEVDCHNLLIAQDITGQDNPEVVPADFEAVRGQERSIFRLLASGMVTTYSAAVFERIDAMREDKTRIGLLKRTDRLFKVPADQQGYAPGEALESFIIENLTAAGNLQSALLRIIPALATRDNLTGALLSAQQIQLYEQIAKGSEQFIRDFSLVPSALSRFVGESLFGEQQPGLWDSILLAGNPYVLLDYFSLVPSKTGLRVDFSESFKQVLTAKVEELKQTIDPRTEKPVITDDNWFGCPGIHKIDGSQLNIEMWRQHVALAPQLYELVA